MHFIHFLLLSISLVSVRSARILAWFPATSISHQVVFRPVTQELAKRGHEVVVITPDPAFPPGQTPPNLTEIDFHELYSIWRELVMSNKISTGDHSNAVTAMKTMMPLVATLIEKQITSERVQNLLKNETKKFDLLILEAIGKQLLPLKDVLNIPVILFSSGSGFNLLYSATGAPVNPVLMYPNMFRQKLNNLTLTDKLLEFYNQYQINSYVDESSEYEKEMMRKVFGPDITVDYHELMKNVDLLFLNLNPMWDQNRPVPPGIVYLGGLHQKAEKELPKLMKNVDLMMLNLNQIWDQNRTVPPGIVYLGGLHQKQAKDLPKEWQSYLDSSKNGVIYVSFGTNVSPSHLPPERIQLLVKVFSQLPYDILWKWDKDELPGRSANIRIAKWLPQSDLLRHPKVKAFITQCGLQSTDEAITAGVPLIGMPMLGDQWYNAEMYEKFKIGIRADLSGLTEEKLKEVIDKIVNDESYRKNIEKLRNIMQDQPQTPLERAVWWTEYVIRHGGAKHLRAPAANMTWAEYLDLELLAAIAGIVLTAISLVVLAIYLVVRFIRNTLFPTKKLKKS